MTFKETFIPLGLGAAKSAGNAFYGATGALLNSIGNLLNEDYTPPTNEQLAGRADLARLATPSWLPQDYFNGLYLDLPPEQNFLQKSGNYLLDVNSQLQDDINSTRKNYFDDNPSFWPRAMEGLGTIATPAIAGGLGGTLAHILTEAAAETGNFATDVYSQGRFDDNARNIAGKNFLANSALNAGLSFIPSGEDLLKKWDRFRKWTPLQKFLANMGKEIIEEAIIQQPLQDSIMNASHETLNGNGDFTPNLILGLEDYPQNLFNVFNGDVTIPNIERRIK